MASAWRGRSDRCRARPDPATRRAAPTRPAAPGARRGIGLGGGPRPTPPRAAGPFGARGGNLPGPLASFVGRRAELAAVARLLAADGVRLLTLTGPGGVGKTRLALELARAVSGDYPDGVWLVELASLADPALAPQAVAAALGVREEAGRPLPATLAAALGDRRALLLLDNCEHVLDACAALAEALLRACPRLTILATSRAPLGIAGEAARPLPALGLPPADPPPTVEAVGAAEAVQLFLERAAAAQAPVALTPATAPLVAQLCRRLDGLPLALELAAARARVLSLEQLVARLDDRFSLLNNGGRAAVPRQRTLRATLDWSHGLLTEPERVLLRRLSVFAGGWTLAAAEAICAGDGVGAAEVLDLLAALVDQSLAQVETRDGEARYRLLETVRAYAAERLAAAGEAAATRRRHRDWCLALAEQAAPLLAAAAQLPWLARLDAERDNLQAALAACLAAGDALGLRLAADLWPYWRLRGRPTEGRRWLEASLDRCAATPTGWRARALHGVGMLAVAQGDFPAARARLEASLAMSRGLGERVTTAWTLRELGMLLPRLGELERGRALLAEALATSRAIGDRLAEGASLAGLGWLAIRDGDHRRARAALEAALPLLRAGGDRLLIASALRDLGRLLCDEGEYDAARARLAESEAVARELGWRDVMTRLYRAHAALWQGRLPEARAQFEAGLALARAVGDQDEFASHQLGLGWLAALDGDPAAAARLLEDSLAMATATGSRSVQARALSWLGRLAAGRGDAARATALLRESLAIRRALGHRRGVAECLEALAAIGVEAAPTAPAQAARLLAAAAAVRAAIEAPLHPIEQPGHEAALRAARTALGEGAFAAAWAAGQALTPEAAVAEALTGGPPPSAGAAPPPGAPADLADLTRREVEVLRLVAAGRSGREIAAELALSARTVERHITNLYGKLGLRNRAEATVLALRHGLA